MDIFMDIQKQNILGYKQYNPFSDGIPGTDPKPGKIIYGKNVLKKTY